MDQLLITRIDKYIHSTLLHHCLHNDNHANHIGVCAHTMNVARVARPFPLAYKPQHIEWERGNKISHNTRNVKKDYTVLLIQHDGNLASDVSTRCSGRPQGNEKLVLRLVNL